MEHLNRHQLILLVLLITFVTSIATGIMTVSLLQQAPVEVTRNINNVVERTIQTVVPDSISSAINPPSKDVTTVVVKEEDMIISSINKNIKSIVRISETNSLGTKIFYGIGVVVSKDGLIAADRQTIVADSVYSAVWSDGSEWKLVPLGVDKDTNSIFFKVNLPEKTKYDFSPATIASADLQLGQTVVGLGGETQNAVAVGRVSSFVMKESGTGTSTVKYISGVQSDVSTKDLVSGSPFFNLSGDLVGMKLSSGVSGSFTPVAVIHKEQNIVNQ